MGRKQYQSQEPGYHRTGRKRWVWPIRTAGFASGPVREEPSSISSAGERRILMKPHLPMPRRKGKACKGKSMPAQMKIALTGQPGIQTITAPIFLSRTPPILRIPVKLYPQSPNSLLSFCCHWAYLSPEDIWGGSAIKFQARCAVSEFNKLFKSATFNCNKDKSPGNQSFPQLKIEACDSPSKFHALK